MKKKLLCSLEDHIQKWMDDNCEEHEWPDGFVYSDEVEDMALAASLVFDASVKGQDFAKAESA